jgi:SAM-dependent methyltransferase
VQEAPFPQVEVVLGQPEDPKLPTEQLDAVLIVNSYHEMPRHLQMLEHIRMALKPGGRLLITEPMSIERRNESREVQEKHHVIAPELVEQDLRQEGFEIIVLNDDFIQYPESGRRDWLILARRP